MPHMHSTNLLLLLLEIYCWPLWWVLLQGFATILKVVERSSSICSNRFINKRFILIFNMPLQKCRSY